jgi:hypothetical protein
MPKPAGRLAEAALEGPVEMRRIAKAGSIGDGLDAAAGEIGQREAIVGEIEAGVEQPLAESRAFGCVAGLDGAGAR